jgi:hypothetical protein
LHLREEISGIRVPIAHGARENHVRLVATAEAAIALINILKWRPRAASAVKKFTVTDDNGDLQLSASERKLAKRLFTSDFTFEKGMRLYKSIVADGRKFPIDWELRLLELGIAADHSRDDMRNRLELLRKEKSIGEREPAQRLFASDFTFENAMQLYQSTVADGKNFPVEWEIRVLELGIAADPSRDDMRERLKTLQKQKLTERWLRLNAGTSGMNNGQQKDFRLRSIIHPGFGHSGTTSLQRRFFSRRPDFLYCGSPYGDVGGLFSKIKYQDEPFFDVEQLREEYMSFMCKNIGEEQRIVVSDESLTEQPEVYYSPVMMPLTVISGRLYELLPDSTILFTIRRQQDYVISSYFNLKRNYAKLSGRQIEDFDTWFDGQFSQVSNLFLRNLNYANAICAYIARFGRAAVRVLPLELARVQGSTNFLRKLGDLLEVEISKEDEKAFATPENLRLTQLEDDLLNFSTDARFSEFVTHLSEALGAEQFNAVLKNSPPCQISLTDEQQNKIRECSAEGNAWIAKEFDIDLAALEYFT